uniref:Uncharacterized protein n=1 Tax=Arundo donax TaxID=35708 RepID=A0A0A9GMT0_ARUDO
MDLSQILLSAGAGCCSRLFLDGFGEEQGRGCVRTA